MVSRYHYEPLRYVNEHYIHFVYHLAGYLFICCDQQQQNMAVSELSLISTFRKWGIPRNWPFIYSSFSKQSFRFRPALWRERIYDLRQRQSYTVFAYDTARPSLAYLIRWILYNAKRVINSETTTCYLSNDQENMTSIVNIDSILFPNSGWLLIGTAA